MGGRVLLTAHHQQDRRTTLNQKGQGNMSYKITVRRTRTVIRQGGAEWKVIAQKDDGKPEYGYTPIVDQPITEEVEVFEQIVDELDLAKLVMVVNGMTVAYGTK
jgi:hypothetical protein